jgi:peptidoglycan/xylan/chitin deacetylase (PgdA/CDA1 family)
MRYVVRTAALAIAVMCAAGSHLAHACTAKDGGIGVSRIVEIDTTAGPLYGDMSAYVREESFLGPNEVVLTFDDGPVPWITKSILDTLDQFCTKATFFSVGRMAIAYPATVKEVLSRGHTLGTHTWSHPFNLPRSSIERAREEIEKGFAAVAMAAGEPIAPFFRFPGLGDSNPMLAHLQARGIAAFSVDVVSNDSYIGNPQRLTERTIRATVDHNGGILLFHDIKASTAKALPGILAQLKERGFKIVHMRPKTMYTPVGDYDATLQPMLQKSAIAATGAKAHLVPFYGTAGPVNLAKGEERSGEAVAPAEVPVTSLSPEPRVRQSAKSEHAATTSSKNQHLAETKDGAAKQSHVRVRKQKDHPQQMPYSTFFD